MIGTLLIEILILWALFALFMAWVVHGKGPLGGIFYYPKEVQARVLELGLIDEKTLKRRRNTANSVLFIGAFVVLYIMIVPVNGAASYWDCVWQVGVLFLGMEVFDVFAVDTLWVACSDWWDIPGTEDLRYLYQDYRTKIRVKGLKLIVMAIPLSAVAGGLYWLASP